MRKHLCYRQVTHCLNIFVLKGGVNGLFFAVWPTSTELMILVTISFDRFLFSFGDECVGKLSLQRFHLHYYHHITRVYISPCATYSIQNVNLVPGNILWSIIWRHVLSPQNHQIDFFKRSFIILSKCNEWSKGASVGQRSWLDPTLLFSIHIFFAHDLYS